MKRFNRITAAIITFFAATTFAVAAFGQDMPLGFDRPLESIEVPAYGLSLERGETASFDTVGLVRITIGETAIVSKEYDEEEERFVITAEQTGTTFLRAYRSDGTEVTVKVTVQG